MNEKLRKIVASGTNEASVLVLLNMRRQTKATPIIDRQTRTASSFATALPTSRCGM